MQRNQLRHLCVLSHRQPITRRPARLKPSASEKPSRAACSPRSASRSSSRTGFPRSFGSARRLLQKGPGLGSPSLYCHASFSRENGERVRHLLWTQQRMSMQLQHTSCMVASDCSCLKIVVRFPLTICAFIRVLARAQPNFVGFPPFLRRDSTLRTQGEEVARAVCRPRPSETILRLAVGCRA